MSDPHHQTQLITAQQVLARENWAKLARGLTADEVHPQARADADNAFTALRHGVVDLGY